MVYERCRDTYNEMRYLVALLHSALAAFEAARSATKMAWFNIVTVLISSKMGER